MNPLLTIAGRTFQSRLLIGSAGYPDFQTMAACFEASGAEIVTVAVRRIDLQDKLQDTILKYIDPFTLFFIAQYGRMLHRPRSDPYCTVSQRSP